MSRLPAGIAYDAAFRLFCTPELSYYRAANHLQLAQRCPVSLRNAHWRRIVTPVADIQTYIFEPDRRVALGTVLVVHGWTGEASFMTALAEPIRRAGYRVVLFDLLSAWAQQRTFDQSHRMCASDRNHWPPVRPAQRNRCAFVRRHDLACCGRGATADASCPCDAAYRSRCQSE